MQVKVIAQMDNTIDHTFESANRIYDINGIAPTVNTCGGGGLQPKILEIKKAGVIACFAMNASQQYGMKPNGGGISKTLKAAQHDIAILERVWKSEE